MWQRRMHDISWQRIVLVLLPSALWIFMFVRRYFSTLEYTGAFLNMLWQFQAALVLNIWLLHENIWQFNLQDSLFYGVSVDVLLGQTVLISSLNLLLTEKKVLTKFIVDFIVIFVIYIYSALVTEHEFWWLGLLLMQMLSVLPALLLAEWTIKQKHIYLRATLQILCWVCLLYWLFPALVFIGTNDSWSVFLNRSLVDNLLYLLPMIFPGLILLSACKEFAVKGDGTPFPYDPPKRLVYTGIYAYISNPMQVGICLSMAWWGIILNNFWISLSAGIAVVLFIVFKDICNGSCTIPDKDSDWHRYQQQVPKWWLRVTPFKK